MGVTTITMTTATASPPPTLSLSADPILPLSSGPSHCCPSCGFSLPRPTSSPLVSTAADDSSDKGSAIESVGPATSLVEAQARITDLEAQVRLLNHKASAAIDRWADYEDELAKLRNQIQAQEEPKPAPVVSSGGVANRLSALLTRKSTPNLRPTSSSSSQPPSTSTTTNPPPCIPPQTPTGLQATKSTPNLLAPESAATPSIESTAAADPNHANATASHPLNAHADLLSALHHEQSLRKAAESRLSSTSKEVEELSVSLFEQANEMVATERRARAKLEERVEVLERRDVEKRRRLERLEGAVGRIERVKALLGEDRIKKMGMEGKGVTGRSEKEVGDGVS